MNDQWKGMEQMMLLDLNKKEDVKIGFQSITVKKGSIIEFTDEDGDVRRSKIESDLTMRVDATQTINATEV